MFAPYQISHSVTVIQKSWFKNFLVEPGSIESCIHGQLNITNQSLLIRSCVNSIRIKSLIQHQPLEHNPAIQLEVHAANGNIAQSKVTFHFIRSKCKNQII